MHGENLKLIDKGLFVQQPVHFPQLNTVRTLLPVTHNILTQVNYSFFSDVKDVVINGTEFGVISILL